MLPFTMVLCVGGLLCYLLLWCIVKEVCCVTFYHGIMCRRIVVLPCTMVHSVGGLLCYILPWYYV